MQKKDYYNQIKKLIINNEVNRKVKEYSINRNDLEAKYILVNYLMMLVSIMGEI